MTKLSPDHRHNAAIRARQGVPCRRVLLFV